MGSRDNTCRALSHINQDGRANLPIAYKQACSAGLKMLTIHAQNFLVRWQGRV